MGSKYTVSRPHSIFTADPIGGVGEITHRGPIPVLVGIDVEKAAEWDARKPYKGVLVAWRETGKSAENINVTVNARPLGSSQ